MRKLFESYKHILVSVFSFVLLCSIFAVQVSALGTPPPASPADLQVSETALGFQIPTLGEILTFAIRGFFVIAGLAALFYMLLGAFAWVTSGGDKDAVSAAQQKIQAAVVGVLVIIVVLAIVWTLENVIFQKTVCFGLSCPVTLPTLLKP
jgi:hypothetical protein